MKKILSILLIAAMLISMLSIMPLSVVAEPVGNPVSNAAEFAAMSAGGQYYLTADITVSAPYANAFTGTLDGNGKTITTTAPLFNDVRGTIKNLTVGGTIDYSTKESNVGAVAIAATGATFTKVTNNATITGHPAKTGQASGGIVGRVAGGDCTFTNVSNTGNISGHNVGGIVGAFGGEGYSTTFTGCTNSGAILYTNDGTNTYKTNPKIGGIIGAADGVSMTISNCLNTGNITGGDGSGSGAGGIVGYSLIAQSGLTISGCENRGKVKHIGVGGGIIGFADYAIYVESCLNDAQIVPFPASETPKDTTNCTSGGIAGKVGKTYDKSLSTFKNCVNKGSVSSTSNQASGIVAYLCTLGKFENCINFGDIDAAQNGFAGGITGQNRYFSATYKNCINYGDISSTGPYTCRLGGIVGRIYNEGTDNNKHTFTNCGNEGTISGLTVAAGLVGTFDNKKSANVLTLELLNCYNAGTVTSTTSRAVGLVGEFGASSTKADVLICRNTYVGGTITGDTPGPGHNFATVYVSNTAATVTLEDNYIVEGVAPTYYHLGGSVSFPEDFVYSDAAYDTKTENGAAVRLDNPTGLRFTGFVSKAYLDSVIAANSGADITYGMIIAPTAYVTAAGEFTIEALTTAGKTYKEVEALSDANSATANTDGFYKFHCVLATVREENYTHEFSAITYIKIVDGANTTYIYADSSTSRSIDVVANAALADLSDTEEVGYGHLIESGTDAGKYSPYTKTQRDILSGFTTGA